MDTTHWNILEGMWENLLSSPQLGSAQRWTLYFPEGSIFLVEVLKNVFGRVEKDKQIDIQRALDPLAILDIFPLFLIKFLPTEVLQKHLGHIIYVLRVIGSFPMIFW